MSNEESLVIEISYEESDANFEKVKKWADEVDLVQFWFGFNGATASVQRGDDTCVHCEDGVAGSRLINEVHRILGEG